ncbi:MAG: YesL family protein [Ruminococcus sp.]|nr:YesL family protein [Ruminococcus sp.]
MGLMPRDPSQKGVLKTPHEKTGFVKYAAIYFSHFWKLMALNFIYVLFCLPIVTIGPATAALTKVCRNYSQERHAYLFADFWAAFKQNFKQGLFFGLLNVLLTAVFAVGLPFYKQWADMMPIMYVPMFVMFAFMIVVVMMDFYIYIMVSSTHLTVKQILKNSYILAYLGLKKTLICFFVYVILMSICFFLLPVSVIILMTLPFSFIAFLNCSLCYPVVRKYIIQPYYDQLGEENPEDIYLDTGDDRIFKDAPEYESADQKKAKKKKKVVK